MNWMFRTTKVSIRLWKCLLVRRESFEHALGPKMYDSNEQEFWVLHMATG